MDETSNFILIQSAAMRPDPALLEELFEAGAHVFALTAHDDASLEPRYRGKRPLRKGWNSPTAKSLTRDEAAAHMRAGRNIGERLTPEDLVIDIDPRHFNDGADYSDPDDAASAAFRALEEWCAEHGIHHSVWPIFVTGSGGLHVRLKKPEDLAIVTKLERRPGFEFKTAGTYIVAAGSIHAKTGRLYQPWFLNLVRLKDAPLAPPALLNLLRRPEPKTVLAGGGELDPEQLDELLAVLDPTEFREHDKWFALMCASHEATSGSGEMEFLLWSALDPFYTDDIQANRLRWRSLRLDKPGIATVATLYKAVVQAGRADLIPHRLSAADEFDEVDPEWLARDATTEAEAPLEAEGPKGMRFTPYVFKDPSAIAPRDWLMKPNYIRQFATGTLGHGGVGKSILLMVEACALASGLPLLDAQPCGQFRWLYWNGEDPVQELDRRFAAIRKHHNLSQDNLEGFLFVDSGRVMPIDIVTIDPKTRVAVPRDRDALIEALRYHKLDGMTIDPFVSCHSVPENANEMIEEVAEAWNDVAERANVAIHISHHAVKARGRDVEAMDYRGGGAALAKLRNLRVLNGMTEKEAVRAGIEPVKRRYYFRADDSAKANLLPPAERTEWYHLASVDLGNQDLARHGLYAESDKIGVPQPWDYVVAEDDSLEPFPEEIAEVFSAMGDDPWRIKSNSRDRWVGIPIAQVLGLDITDAKVRSQLNDLIARWEEDGVLLRSKPDKRDAHGNLREGYVPGALPRYEVPDLSTEGDSAK